MNKRSFVKARSAVAIWARSAPATSSRAAVPIASMQEHGERGEGFWEVEVLNYAKSGRARRLATYPVRRRTGTS
jgi:hypothetical protein